MKLYKTAKGAVIEDSDKFYLVKDDWDTLINRDELYKYLTNRVSSAEPVNQVADEDILAPIGSQEVWAAGVTYLRSRDARMEESEGSGGATMYDKVYDAERPELFFKSLAHRVSGHNQYVNIRRDSTWNVPEPELTLFISSSGRIQGYTVGNDMSSRSIEGENPLYLPQAKIYERSAALGPCLFISENIIPTETEIEMTIKRNGKEVYKDSVAIYRMKRSLTELAGYLFRECDFENGCYLMTGTCLVPPNDFTLNEEDEVYISIDHIGTLKNKIAFKNDAVKLV
jgi:2-dehydro-3-deoxy-D-arabinonate dehydratase